MLKEEASEYLTYEIGLAIHKYWLPIICPFGILGNILAFFVLTQKHNRHISCCLFMSALAVSDAGVLSTAAYNFCATVLLKDKYIMTDIDCQLQVYISHVSFINSVILIISMTIDRYIAIKYPLKASFYCTPKRAKITIIVALTVSLIYNLPLTFTSRMVNHVTCAFLSSPGRLTEVLASINSVISTVIPFITILGLNIAIIKAYRDHHQTKLTRHKGTPGRHLDEIEMPRLGNMKKEPKTPASIEIRKETKTLDSGNIKKMTKTPTFGNIETLDSGNFMKEIKTSAFGNTRKEIKTLASSNIKRQTSRKEMYLTAMLLWVTFAFLLLTLPVHIRYALYTFIDKHESASTYAMYVLIYNISQKCYYTNSTVNIMLYCLSGPKFRKDLKRLFCGPPKSHQNSKASLVDMYGSSNTEET